MKAHELVKLLLERPDSDVWIVHKDFPNGNRYFQVTEDNAFVADDGSIEIDIRTWD